MPSCRSTLIDMYVIVVVVAQTILSFDTPVRFKNSADSMGLSQSDLTASLVGLAGQVVVSVLGCLVAILTYVLYTVISADSGKEALEV